MSSYKHFDPKVIKKRRKSRGKSGDTQHELYILKTNRHLVAVLYDKAEQRDISSISTRPAGFVHAETRTLDAVAIGKQFAELCKSKNIEKIYFNKMNYKFHGLVKSVVESVRESGINI